MDFLSGAQPWSDKHHNVVFCADNLIQNGDGMEAWYKLTETVMHKKAVGNKNSTKNNDAQQM